MTEEEAKTKLCVHQPFKRREHNTVWYVTPKCVGSDCMAWRWEHIYIHGNDDGLSDTEGHCGLAGKP